MGIEYTIGQAIMGEIPEELALARVAVHAAVVTALFCRLPSCGAVLDQTTAQVIETGRGSVTALCGKHHMAADATQGIVNAYNTTADVHTWEGTTHYGPDAPVEGETYRLTSGPDETSIANGDTWADSKVNGDDNG